MKLYIKKIKVYSIVLLSLLLGISCTDFDELNTDPNSASEMDPDLMLTTVQYLPGSNWQEQYRYWIYPGGFMNHWTGKYAVTEYGGFGQQHSNYQERLWITYYPNVINKVVALIESTKDDESYVNVNSMARILKVQNFLKLTDYYGDIPYFDAGRGFYDDKLTPKYDKQEDIYNDFFKELKEAENALDESKPSAKYDLIYNGDIAKWKKYANSLRLRIAMRLIKINPTKAQQEAEDAIAAGVFTSNEDISYVKYENVRSPVSGTGKGNGVATYLRGSNDAVGSDTYISTELVEVLEEMDDPRLLNQYYCMSALNDVDRTDITDLVLQERGSYAAMTCQAQRFRWDPNTKYNSPWSVTIENNGSPLTINQYTYMMRPSKYLMEYDAPYIYISYAEVEFLMAEAAARGWNVNGTAAEHYKNGLEASVRQWTLFGAPVDENEVTAFSAANPLTIGDELNEINTQLWVLHFIDPLEAWANFRRSGLPEIEFYNYQPSVNQSNGVAPRRMIYPVEEQTKNTDNYNEAVSRIGEDNWTKRVWWDKQ